MGRPRLRTKAYLYAATDRTASADGSPCVQELWTDARLSPILLTMTNDPEEQDKKIREIINDRRDEEKDVPPSLLD